METFKVEVIIHYKKGVLDPQGIAVEQASKSLGFENVENVRIGKHITFEIRAKDESEARHIVNKMAEKFLVNPVIEEYSFKVERK